MLTLFDLIIATALLAGLGVVVASIRSFMATCALGLILWLPANALADEMAVLVDENTAGRVVAAIANISFQAGSLGLFAVPYARHWTLLLTAVAAGTGALAACALVPTSPSIIAAAAVLSGYCGSVGSTVVWPVLLSKDSVKAFAVGLSLANYLSGMALMAQGGASDPRFSASVYFWAAFVGFVATAAFSLSRHATLFKTKTPAETLLSDADDHTDNDQEPPPQAVAITWHMRAMALAYCVAYMAPALWPFFLGVTYRYTLVACNMADTAGRAITAIPISMHVVIAATTLFGAVSLAAPFCATSLGSQWLYTFMAAAVFAIRGVYITEAQAAVPTTLRPQLSYAAQAGGAGGAIIGLVLAFLL